jgi:hypothetical protein
VQITIPSEFCKDWEVVHPLSRGKALATAPPREQRNIPLYNRWLSEGSKLIFKKIKQRYAIEGIGDEFPILAPSSLGREPEEMKFPKGCLNFRAQTPSY